MSQQTSSPDLTGAVWATRKNLKVGDAILTFPNGYLTAKTFRGDVVFRTVEQIVAGTNPVTYLEDGIKVHAGVATKMWIRPLQTCQHCGTTIARKLDPTGQRGVAWAETHEDYMDYAFQCGLSPDHRHTPVI